MNNYKQHQALLKLFKLALQKKYPSARLFDRPVGLFKTVYGGTVKVGTTGFPDLEVWFPTTNGIIITHYEVKTGKGKQSKKQKTADKLISLMNGFYEVIREDYTYKKTEEFLKGKTLIGVDFSLLENS